MKTRTFVCESISEALVRIKRELGGSAIILSTREIPGPSENRPLVEVTVASESSDPPAKPRPKGLSYQASWKRAAVPAQPEKKKSPAKPEPVLRSPQFTRYHKPEEHRPAPAPFSRRIGPGVQQTQTSPVQQFEERTRTAYDSIAGLDEPLGKIRELVELPMRYPQMFSKLGIDAPSGILLYGPPGCGKTLIAKAIAKESNAYFQIVNGPELVGPHFGESEANLRKVFETAAKKAPSIIYFDEIDAIAPNRNEAQQGGEKRLVTQLLTLMDGIEKRGQVIVIASTNLPNTIDPALRRPGRFDREIVISVPDEKSRQDILKVHTRHMSLGEDIDLQKIAEMTHGFVGADLASLCQEAGILAIQEVLPQVDERGGILSTRFLGRLQVRMEHFETALKSMKPSSLRSVSVEVPDVKWGDVGGLVHVKERLQEAVIWPLKHGALFKKADVTPPRGILLTGPPGTGKTLLAKALANESGVNFISVKGPSLVSKYVGDSEKAIREVFAQARQAAPCIIFFDEIDAIAPRRGQSSESACGDRIVAQLLTEMDGIEALKGVLVLAATNRPEAIDGALLRSGRFDEIIEIPNPDVDSRLEILRVHTRNKPMAKGIDLAKLAILTEGMSGAELEAACRQAAMSAVRRTVDSENTTRQCAITHRDLAQAINHIRAKAGKAAIVDERPRILVVDDERDVLNLICKVLTRHGYEGVPFQHPGEALEHIRSEYFDVALLDIHLPDKDGVQLLKDIKVVQPHLGVIMVTAEADVHYAIESMKAGASDYLLKPFDLETLVCSIQEAIQKARHSGSPAATAEIGSA